ncbi:MAG: hypothetical protein HY931_03915 [Candidatus Falkowbacteria bacterium]|nr:MAG: hypothetical protein HY931_03915 [Candidatus Falkowbacteria bacterium]
MFISQVGKPTKIKKAIYLVAFIFFGLLLSFNLHSLMEVGYLELAARHNLAVHFYGICALPPFIQILLPILGIIFGLYFGLYWWRKIYLERCLDKFYGKVKNKKV